MNTKTLSARALSVIDQYLYLKVGSAVCSVPYFNNKTVKNRGALSVHVGKGSPQEIFEEAETLALKAHVPLNSLADESLKKLLVDNNVGIDCSGFAFYVLSAESKERGKGSLDKHISSLSSRGLLSKFVAAIHPVRHTDVATFAHEKNSLPISLTEVQPGDLITMLAERDHILVIHQVEYQNFLPYRIHYTHTISYPEDGVYGSGIKQGVIEISDSSKPITEATWIENGKQGAENPIYMRAVKSETEVRRLKSF